MKEILEGLRVFWQSLVLPVYEKGEGFLSTDLPRLIWNPSLPSNGESCASSLEAWFDAEDSTGRQLFLDRVESAVPEHGRLLRIGSHAVWIVRDSPFLTLRTDRLHPSLCRITLRVLISCTGN